MYCYVVGANVFHPALTLRRHGFLRKFYVSLIHFKRHKTFAQLRPSGSAVGTWYIRSSSWTISVEPYSASTAHIESARLHSYPAFREADQFHLVVLHGSTINTSSRFRRRFNNRVYICFMFISQHFIFINLYPFNKSSTSWSVEF